MNTIDQKHLLNLVTHPKFLARLKNKADECGTNIIIVDEKYTSKTCSSCGHVKTKRFTSKEYRCEKCLLKIDRDRNGAINILKKLFLPSGENRADRANGIDIQVLSEEKTSSRRVVKSNCQRMSITKSIGEFKYCKY